MTQEFDAARDQVLAIITDNPDIEFQTVSEKTGARRELLHAVFCNLSRNGIIIKTNTTPKKWRASPMYLNHKFGGIYNESANEGNLCGY